jgi:hypothetical protein
VTWKPVNTPDERSALDAQISAVEKFSKAFEKALKEAGLGDRPSYAGMLEAVKSQGTLFPKDGEAMIKQSLDTEPVIDYVNHQGFTYELTADGDLDVIVKYGASNEKLSTLPADATVIAALPAELDERVWRLWSGRTRGRSRS